MIYKYLRTMRRKSNLKQEDISKKCNIAKTTLSGYENNYRQPTFEVIQKIANSCGYEIIFRNINTKEELNSENIDREEI